MSSTGTILDVIAERFDLTTIKREQAVFSCPAADLLDAEKMKRLLELYTPMVKGKDQSVGEVYMTGWFRGPMLALIYMLSVGKQAVNLSLDNLTIQLFKASYNNKEYYRCEFLIRHSELEDGPEDQRHYEQWAQEKMGGFYEYTVRPVLESIAAVGTLKAGMLWSQLPTSLEYGHELLMKSDASIVAKQRAERIYGLIKSLDGERFGRTKNPLDVKFRMTESMDDPNKQVRMKYACCLYYLVEDGYYCFTCPRIKESEREDRRAECRAAKQG
ncbi:hypothetical protein KP806_10970 [Paenibacillus sp. N4]|uniref:hypothetical protein n=1 Tax=Paenibacillus vietnamensis TaxID=2590547 RepID=UPI001CD085E0|nr:hypothetical protein [Paenibacillus vietnamensis]MCA0755575.1 hypothetical protein [Paenibacillus vietnamensis]